jgi:hypothetical protein
MEWFVNPWAMIFGGILVSVPIIIHLINRMRFKRIRWAAMEFLLKSQKRNRRRLIIEQLILLALRCLLVLLGGLLTAKLLLGSDKNEHGTTHIVILDDTPSMADHWQEKGPRRTSFDLGKEQIKEIAKSAVDAPSAQQMRLFLLSDLTKPLYDRRLSDRTQEELNAILAPKITTALHVSPIVAFEEARKQFAEIGQGQKVFHFVSDFRDSDWGTGPRAEDLHQAVNNLTDSGAHIDFVDVAHPDRKGAQPALHHDNWAIVDFHCESHVVIKDQNTDFKITVHNYGSSNKRRLLKVYLNGEEMLGARRQVPSDQSRSLPPGSEETETITLTLGKTRIVEPIKAGDKREDRERKRRADQEFAHLQAVIEPEETGLGIDNVRDLVVEVRQKVPTLIVDGSGVEGEGEGGDFRLLKSALETSRLYEIERCTVDELDKMPLDLYPTMLFVNVSEIPSEKTRQRLQDYVRAGGGVAFFLGDKCKPTFYNDLFAKYDGLFPLQIDNTPYNIIDPNGTLTDEQREEARDVRRKDPELKVLFRDPHHPLVATLAEDRPGQPALAPLFSSLELEKYHRAKSRSIWEAAKGLAGKAEEPILLPNNQSIDVYKARAQELANEAMTSVKSLAETEKEFAKYVDPVINYRSKIITALSQSYKFHLVKAMDAMLNDRGPEGDSLHPDMALLWAHPKMADLRKQLEEFRQRVLYGDPLVVSRIYGKGRTLAFLTSAGVQSRWNKWADGGLVSLTFPPLIIDLQGYLTGQGDDYNRLIGEPVKLGFDAAKYLPKVYRRFKPQPDPESKDRLLREPPTEDQGEQRLQTTGRTLAEKTLTALAGAGVPPPEVAALKDRPFASPDQAKKEVDELIAKHKAKPVEVELAQTAGLLTFDLQDVRRPGTYLLDFFSIDKNGNPGPIEQRAFAFNVDVQRESDLRRVAREKLERPQAGKDGKTGTVVMRVPGDNFEEYKEEQSNASQSPWLYILILLVLIAEQAMAVHLSFHLKESEAAPAGGTKSATAAA